MENVAEGQKQQVTLKLERRDVDALKKAANEQFITPAACARAILLRELRKTPEKAEQNSELVQHVR